MSGDDMRISTVAIGEFRKAFELVVLASLCCVLMVNEQQKF